MDLEAFKAMHPMVWIILVAAAVISGAVIFNRAIHLLLKLAVIGVAVLFVVYFLIQANVITLPEVEKSYEKNLPHL
ncbi:hypothetical protein P4E94_03425 [Pontiellaceae bacterium B12219]|nr:hypothetical protein [Pontiellaceae bacterium B12219]